MINVSNAIIVTLGNVGYQVAHHFLKQLRIEHPEVQMPTIQVVSILEEEPRQAVRRELSSLGIAIRPTDPEVRTIAEKLFPNHPFSADATEFAQQLTDFPRPRGQIALHYHVYALQQTLLEARRTIFGTSLDVMGQQQTGSPTQRSIQVYLICSLANSFMTGLLPDLPFIIHHTLKEGTPDDFFINIQLVLAMPGFRGDFRAHEEKVYNQDDPRFRLYAQTQVFAAAAACLREIDELFGGAPKMYSRRFSRFLRIHIRHNPLGEGRIHLLEPTNEQEKTLEDVQMLTMMVAEWLHTAVTTPLHTFFESPTIHDSQQIYSSFGYARLTIPIQRWIERMRIRHQTDLLAAILEPNTIQTDLDIASIRSQLHLTDAELRAALVSETPFNEVRLQPLAFGGVALNSADTLLVSLQNRYTQLLGNNLTELRTQIHTRKRQLTSKTGENNSNLIEPLEQYVLQLLDDPHGGILKAHLFLEKLRDDLKKDRHQIEEQERQKRLSAQKMGGRVEKARAVYLGRVAVADGLKPLPFVGLTTLLLLAAVPIISLIISFAVQKEPIGSWLILTALMVLSLIVFGRIVNTLRLTRYRTIKTYDERLQAFRDADFLDSYRQLYDGLIQWTGNLRQGINEIWENLIEIRTELNADWERVKNPALLSGVTSDQFAEQLLTLEMMRPYEKTILDSDLYEATELLRQEVGSPSQWVKNGTDRTLWGEQLNDFCHKRVAHILMPLNLQEAFKRLSPRELGNKVSRLKQISAPYWRHDPTKTTLQAPPQIVVGLADKTLLSEAKLSFGGQIDYFPIASSHELVVTSIRHGVSLANLNHFTQQLTASYEQVIHQEREMLHTAEDRLALPTPQEVASADLMIRTLPMRQLYAIGRALDVIRMGEMNGATGFECSWKNGFGVEEFLGNTPVETVFLLEREKELQESIRTAVEKVWKKKSSLSLIKVWINRIDERQIEYWARLAAEDFLEALDVSS